MLAIESTGGKELHDDALIAADLPAAVLALGVLAPRDMAFLWDMIVDVAATHDVIASGDTACGFANTAMVLAEMRHIPRVWAAVIRVLLGPAQPRCLRTRGGWPEQRLRLRGAVSQGDHRAPDLA